MKETTLTGSWKISVTYGSGYGKLLDQKLICHAEFFDNDSKITGTIVDVDGAGMSPDMANIEGTYKEGILKFIKQYVSLHTLNHKYEIEVDRSKEGGKIAYEAKYNENNNEFSGRWTYIDEVYSGEGTWLMKRL